MRQHRRSAVQWPTILERSMPGPRRLYKRSRLPRYGAFVERPSLSSDAVDIRRPPPPIEGRVGTFTGFSTLRFSFFRGHPRLRDNISRENVDESGIAAERDSIPEPYGVGA